MSRLLYPGKPSPEKRPERVRGPPFPVIWNMETGDPDDLLTLLMLLGHPAVDLRAVTVTPGGADQVNIVRWARHWFGRFDLPVGTARPPRELEAQDVKAVGHAKNRVSKWHHRAFGLPNVMEYEAEVGADLLDRVLSEETVLISGAPLKPLHAFLKQATLRLYDRAPCFGRLVIQGGFAGEGVVPSERQLEKFRGKTTAPSFNLNGDPKAVFAVLERRHMFSDIRFVSKNVCHGVMYDASLHALVEQELKDVLPTSSAFRDPFRRVGEDVRDPLEEAGSPRGLYLVLLRQGMGDYLRRRPEGKAFHDPLAAACALDPSIAEWAEVEVYRERGEWGARLAPGSGVHIIVGYDHDKFVDVVLGRSPQRVR